MDWKLDLTTLHSLKTVTKLGSVTSSAKNLHLTESAVSMQSIRLGQNFYHYLPKRAGSMVVLTNQREQLVGYIRHTVVLNGEEKSFQPFQ